MTAATLSKSAPVTPARASGHCHTVTTPTLSPGAPRGPLSKSTLTSLNQSDASAGRERDRANERLVAAAVYKKPIGDIIRSQPIVKRCRLDAAIGFLLRIF